MRCCIGDHMSASCLCLLLPILHDQSDHQPVIGALVNGKCFDRLAAINLSLPLPIVREGVRELDTSELGRSTGAMFHGIDHFGPGRAALLHSQQSVGVNADSHRPTSFTSTSPNPTTSRRNSDNCSA